MTDREYITMRLQEQREERPEPTRKKGLFGHRRRDRAVHRESELINWQRNI